VLGASSPTVEGREQWREAFSAINAYNAQLIEQQNLPAPSSLASPAAHKFVERGQFPIRVKYGK